MNLKKIKKIFYEYFYEGMIAILSAISVFAAFFLIKNGLSEKKDKLLIDKHNALKKIDKLESSDKKIQRSILANKSDVKYIKSEIQKIADEEDTEELDSFFDKRVK